MGSQETPKPKKHICAGLLAHVDAGKTTLSEALLYQSGAIRHLGRVDHQDAFLDTDHLERERGITIFSKQAVLPVEGGSITLLDTPGHVDFSSEMERTLQVLDCAVLVISGTDGVQAHTRTLWRLLARYQVPTFLFVNKMDLAGANRPALLEGLRAALSDGCTDFGDPEEVLWENAATCDEGALERYLEGGRLSDEEIADLVARRLIFPCYFGSALRLEGVQELLEGLMRYAPQPCYSDDFAARVYKIGRDDRGARLTYLKVTGGTLRVKDLVSGGGDPPWEEKIDQIRIYSGAKYQAVGEAPAGTVCAVTGLSKTRPGEGLGGEGGETAPALASAFSYRVYRPDSTDPAPLLRALRQLEEEDPQLRVVWDEGTREIRVQLMGQVQLEVLTRLLAQRFGLEAAFDAGSVVYLETIAAPVEGVGHYEPLRHYAEVHLLLEPLPRGSGLRFASACPEDMLEGNWQRLVLTHLAEREHRGVLTGAPITDLRITLVAGRAHVKHTEGGDFRQATYRAVRQGLMTAQSILLEPWYDFTLEVPASQVGRAMSDLQRMDARVDPPGGDGETALLTGSAPVAALGDYALEVASYTRGQGRLACTLGEYQPCRDQERVVAEIGYDPERDVDNPADSVFCDHGAGVVVKWDEVPSHMHVDSGLRLGREVEDPTPEPQPQGRPAPTGSLALDQELLAIYERTYGKVKEARDPFRPPPRPARTSLDDEKYTIRTLDQGPEYLLVDGYNIIYAWDELKQAAQHSLDAARQLLMDLLSNYQGYKKCVVILVFDAYKVKGSTGAVQHYHNIHVVYTKEAETADTYIERATYEIGRHHRVRVATSDAAEQLIILGHGALRLSARAFRAEVEQVAGQISAILARNNRPQKSRPVAQAFARAEEGRAKP